MASHASKIEGVMAAIRRAKVGLMGDSYRALHQCEGILNGALARVHRVAQASKARKARGSRKATKKVASATK